MLIDQALPPSRFFLQPAYAQQRRCTEFLGYENILWFHVMQ
jgi:hypothetical protein